MSIGSARACPSCGKPLGPDSSFCIHCGTDAGPGRRTAQSPQACLHCGDPLPAEAAWCPTCGMSVTAASADDVMESVPDPLASGVDLGARPDGRADADEEVGAFASPALPSSSPLRRPDGPSSSVAAPASLSLFARWQQAWQQGLNFQGRARRADYWGFFLFQFLLSLGLSLVVLILGGSERAIERVGSLFSLVSFVPSLAVAVRRSHDLAWSGWYGLLGLPMLGSIVGGLVGLVAGVLLGGGGFFGAGGLGFGFVFGFWAGYFPVLFRAGQPQANRFGPPPR